MLHAPGILRGHAGDGVPAVGLRRPVELSQSLPCQFIAVRQLVDLRTQSVHAVKPPDVPFMGQAAQKAPGGLACLSAAAPQLPGNDPHGPPLRLGRVKGLPHRRNGIQLHLPGGFEIPVGPLIGGLVGVGMLLDLLCGGLGSCQIVKPSQVHIPVHRRRILRLHHMGWVT